MNPLVRSLFHELADLPQSEREELFDRKAIPQEVRAEVESLLRFAPGKDWDNPHWGPYRPIRVLGTGGMITVYLAERCRSHPDRGGTACQRCHADDENGLQ